ncbi:hypothetical protein CN200_35950, partial [Sinorhizobium meliloti]|uniref:hypothetical protein n=1 Tax=Rhizobium meliloti TaxID=382 RepID=UPI000FD5ED44
MTLDIRGSIKNTKLSLNQYVVFEELIANAIDAYLIRRAYDPSAPDMNVTIEVDFLPADMLEEREVMNVSCGDNGCGLGDDQLKAFLTRDCQEFCAVGHDDEKERIITWLSRKNFWTSSWL